MNGGKPGGIPRGDGVDDGLETSDVAGVVWVLGVAVEDVAADEGTPGAGKLPAPPKAPKGDAWGSRIMEAICSIVRRDSGSDLGGVRGALEPAEKEGRTSFVGNPHFGKLL